MTDERGIDGLALEEQARLVAGADQWHTVAYPEADIPALRVSDGPNGARGEGTEGETSVCFPVGSCMAATWDVELVADIGRALAAESRAKDAGVLLAPTVNLHRHPLGGRNFESYSEDPHLASRLAVAYIRGLQSRGVGACIKHFAGNESEFHRHTMSSVVDERTLREAYLLPFEMAVKEAEPWSLMSSYNRLNGTYASDHHWLLTTVLREQWGFTGAVISDWGGTMSTAPAIEAGCDLEMPGPGNKRRGRLVSAVEAGDASAPDVARNAARVAALARRAAAAEADLGDGPDPAEVAYRAAVQGMVLLRNEGVLPLAGDAARIAVVGPGADPGHIQGGGSSRVSPTERISPLAGIRAHVGSGVDVVHEPGGDIERWCPPLTRADVTWEGEPGAWFEVFADPDLSGEPAVAKRVSQVSQRFFGAVEGIADPRHLSARIRASFRAEASGPHTFGVACAGQARLLVDGAVLIEQDSAADPGDSFYAWGSDEARATVELVAGDDVAIEVEFRRGGAAAMAGAQVGLKPPVADGQFDRAVAAAAAADVAVVVVGLNGTWETEGYDRRTLSLPGRQDELVAAVAAANPKTVVVVNAGSPIAMPWLDQVGAVLLAWYPGQAMGTALAALLFGAETPSGKLPTTFPRRIEDTPAFSNYPGDGEEVVYAEGLDIGYRHYDRHQIEPLFPFGHGLSYTSFGYGPLRLSATEMPGDGTVEVEVDVTNTGDRAGAEVVQLYVAHPDAPVRRPVHELRSFARLALDPGETATARLSLGFRGLARWDTDDGCWRLDAGRIEVQVGASSRDLPGRATFTVTTPADQAP